MSKKDITRKNYFADRIEDVRKGAEARADPEGIIAKKQYPKLPQAAPDIIINTFK